MTHITDIPILTSGPRYTPRLSPLQQRVQRCRGLIEHFDQSQWWSEEKIRAMQFRLLRPLLKHACATVPHYRREFDRAGVRTDQVGPDNWHRVPILTRAILQSEQVHSQRVPLQHGKVMHTQTSGSTGQPVTIHGTDFSQLFFDALNLRDSLWRRRDTTRRHASIKFFPGKTLPAEGLVQSAWSPLIRHMYGSGKSASLDIRTPVDKQLDWLADFDPHYLLTYPSNLKLLLERSRQRDMILPSLLEVRTISEVAPATLFTACRNTWGAHLTDAYSSQELGCIALQCPEHQHYHVQSESLLLEVLNDNGQPCKPGEIGRVVMTSLLNYATPLIRYEIRDYAEVGESCPCGRGLPVLKRIVGRERNALTYPNGEKRWPMLGWARYKEAAPVHQFQFIQHSLEEIEMRLVAERALTSDEEESLKGIVQDALGHPFTIRLTPMNEIAQGKNGKYEEFISKIENTSTEEQAAS